MCRGAKQRVGVGVGGGSHLPSVEMLCTLWIKWWTLWYIYTNRSCFWFVYLIHSRGQRFPNHVRQFFNRRITSHTNSNPIKLSVVIWDYSIQLVFISQYWLGQASIIICFLNSQTKQMSFKILAMSLLYLCNIQVKSIHPFIPINYTHYFHT